MTKFNCIFAGKLTNKNKNKNKNENTRYVYNYVLPDK